MNQEFQLYFHVFVKFPVVKTYCENQIGPWRFRGILGNIYHEVHFSSSLWTSVANILWSVSTECTVRVRSLYLIHIYWLWNFVFRMQIIFHVTKGNFIFWTEEFRFAYANQSVGIYVKATTEFNQFAFSQGSCRSTCESIQIDFFKFRWMRVWATGEYKATFFKSHALAIIKCSANGLNPSSFCQWRTFNFLLRS